MTEWWVRRGEETIGPMLGSDIVASLKQGDIAPGDLACRVGGKDWLLVGAVPEVAEAFAVRRSAPPKESLPMGSAVWMIGNMDGDVLAGPISLDQIQSDLAKGALTGGELLAQAGSTAWRPLTDVLADVATTTKGKLPRPIRTLQTGGVAEVVSQAPVRAQAPVQAQAQAPVQAPAVPFEHWYYAEGKNVVGPFPLDHLRLLLGRGELAPASHVCSSSNQAWRPISTEPALAPRVSPPPIQPPAIATPASPPRPTLPPSSDPSKRKPPPLPARARKTQI